MMWSLMPTNRNIRRGINPNWLTISIVRRIWTWYYRIVWIIVTEDLTMIIRCIGKPRSLVRKAIFTITTGETTYELQMEIQYRIWWCCSSHEKPAKLLFTFTIACSFSTIHCETSLLLSISQIDNCGNEESLAVVNNRQHCFDGDTDTIVPYK